MVWGQVISPSALNCLSTTDFLVDKLGSFWKQDEVFETYSYDYNTLYLHNVVKCIVSYKDSYLIIF